MENWKRFRLFFVLTFNVFIQVQGKWSTNKKLNSTTSGKHTHLFYKNVLRSRKYKNNSSVSAPIFL